MEVSAPVFLQKIFCFVRHLRIIKYRDESWKLGEAPQPSQLWGRDVTPRDNVASVDNSRDVITQYTRRPGNQSVAKATNSCLVGVAWKMPPDEQPTLSSKVSWNDAGMTCQHTNISALKAILQICPSRLLQVLLVLEECGVSARCRTLLIPNLQIYPCLLNINTEYHVFWYSTARKPLPINATFLAQQVNSGHGVWQILYSIL